MKNTYLFFSVLLGLTQAALAASFSQGGPAPGDVYKEFAVSMTRTQWRVTDPGVNLTRFPEAAAFLPNPVINIPIDDLQGATRAEILIDFWEGHDGTTGKKFRFNGKPWISIPEPVGTRYMQQVNHLISVPLAHLSQGTNRLEGTSGPNGWQWGQWGWYGVIVRVYYGPSKPHATGQITSHANGASFGENPRVTASTSSTANRVDFLAYHDGYDTDGDTVYRGWQRNYHRTSWSDAIGINNHVGTDTSAPFASTWNTGWVPDQASGSIKLVARIRNSSGYWYVSPAVTGLSLTRPSSSVKLYKAGGVPQRYWVRANQTKSNTVNIPSLAAATAAIVHASTWNGDDGTSDFWSKINGTVLPRFGSDHFWSYDEVPVPVSRLRTGNNTVTFHSTTLHHGIEIMMPGPCVSVRYGVAAPNPDPTPDPDPPPLGDMVVNGDFETNVSSWSFYSSGLGSAVAASPGYGGSSKAACIAADTAGSNVQFYQSGLRLKPNTDYELVFAAYSNTGNDFRVSLAKHGSPYTNYGVNKLKVDLSTGWQAYALRFTTRNFSSPVEDGRLFFWFADDAQAGDRFYIDQVQMGSPGSVALPEPEPEPEPSAAIVANGGFDVSLFPWSFYTNGSGIAAAEAPGYGGSSQSAVIRIATGGSNIQLYQNGLSLEPYTDYELTFAAYSNTGSDFRVSLGKHSSPYTNYGINKAKVDLSTGWQFYTIIFTTKNFGSPVDDGRLFFWLADDARAGDRFSIDQVRLAPAGSAPPPVPEPEPGPDPATESVVNGGFDATMSSWNFYSNGAGGAMAASPGYGGSAKAAIVRTATGGSNIQLYQNGLSLSPNASYVLSFYAYSNSGHDLRVSLGKHRAPYTNYGLNRNPVDLTTSWQKFTFEFNATNIASPVADGRLYFWFADDARAGDEFFIDQVSLLRVPDTESPSAPASLAANWVNGSDVRLSWDPATDNVGVLGYLIYRNGVDVGESGATSFLDEGLVGPGNVIYTVTAFDDAGNESPASSEAIVVK